MANRLRCRIIAEPGPRQKRLFPAMTCGERQPQPASSKPSGWESDTELVMQRLTELEAIQADPREQARRRTISAIDFLRHDRPAGGPGNLVHHAGIDDSVRLGGPSRICHSPAEI